MHDSKASPAAIALSAMVHTLLIASLLSLDVAAQREMSLPVPGVRVPGAAYALDRATLVFIEERGSAPHFDRPAPPKLTDAGLLELTVRPTPAPVVEMSAIEDAEGTAQSFEPTPLAGDDSAALLEQYVGQVRARIERAWERLDGADTAECLIQLSQGPRGEVLAIDSDDCALGEVSRASLVRAILRASPLPAPPDARLFVPELTLDFTSPDARTTVR